MDEHDGSEDKQDRYADKSDREANLERKADVTAANARRESTPRTATATATRRVSNPTNPALATTRGHVMDVIERKLRQVRRALRWTRSAWQRRYDPYVRKVARRRWRTVFTRGSRP